ncbi:hypothetical protein AVEN_10610-1 [Araneus ventricosus]|uniref:Uncharacterized protein n=1 Tax=Araneus ventricosus TaxID=182803 RepID=A0A4Y2L0M3_ARAVE|nr:hypothetical protein AVEN_10610-1 [Araneus ventricosus]
MADLFFAAVTSVEQQMQSFIFYQNSVPLGSRSRAIIKYAGSPASIGGTIWIGTCPSPLDDRCNVSCRSSQTMASDGHQISGLFSTQVVQGFNI